MWKYTAPTMFFFGVILQICGTVIITQPNFISKSKKDRKDLGIKLIIVGLLLMAVAFYIQNFVEFRMGNWVINPEVIGYN